MHRCSRMRVYAHPGAAAWHTATSYTLQLCRVLHLACRNPELFPQQLTAQHVWAVPPELALSGTVEQVFAVRCMCAATVKTMLDAGMLMMPR